MSYIVTETKAITRNDIRGMMEGQTKTWRLSTPNALQSARVTAHDVGKLTGRRYSTAINYAECTITITRIY